ncbi:hypothetical protein V6R21_06885 [Limibacter armeniacum]|uniref:hypothetical protein n=1 Tax=Limibacter armeniacum TaxID=466084 RepID=UPI002FE53272
MKKSLFKAFSYALLIGATAFTSCSELPEAETAPETTSNARLVNGGSVSSRDQAEIDVVVEKLYGAITFQEGGEPHLEWLKEIFIEDAKMINNAGPEPITFSVDEFIAYAQALQNDYGITQFDEKEVKSRTRGYGSIAHRFSEYETRMIDLDSRIPEAQGVNSIQFINVNGEWKISCMVWDEEIPEQNWKDFKNKKKKKND